MTQPWARLPKPHFFVIGSFMFFSLLIVHTLNTNSVNEIYIKSKKYFINDNTRPSVDHDGFKYILQWTPADVAPFDALGSGMNVFINQNCDYVNCFVTDNKNYFIDVTDFDAIIFNGKSIVDMKEEQMPRSRSPKQIYVFGSMESPDYYPVCQPFFDNFFNRTFTYRLDSDIRWGYITIFDKNNNIIGPKVNMKWPSSFVSNSEDEVLVSNKTKAAAWFVSNCNSESRREEYARLLEMDLNMLGLELDVYGACGKLTCSRDNSDTCLKKLKSDYFFYLSFENSFAEDYVTEKLLAAIHGKTVPVVYGDADYQRFMPPDSYIDARALGPRETARRMHDLIKDPLSYAEMLNWANHYTLRDTADHDICKLCTLLNDDQKMEETSVYNEFRQWWNPKFECVNKITSSLKPLRRT